MTAINDNEARLATWLADHGGVARRLSRVYATDPADQQDLQQEMLVQIWRSLPSFREQARASTWIYRICLNTGLTWKRAWQRRAALLCTEEFAPDEFQSAQAGPSEIHERAQQRDALFAAMRRLPAVQCTLIALALDGLGHQEIAEILGMSENSVAVALLRARRKLGASLKGVSDEL